MKFYKGFLIGASSPSINNNNYSSSLVALSSFELHYFLNLQLGLNIDFQTGLRIRSSNFRYIGSGNHMANIDIEQINQFGFANLELVYSFTNSYETVSYKVSYRVEEIEEINSYYSGDKILISNISQYELRNLAIPLYIDKTFGGRRNNLVLSFGIIPSYNIQLRKDLGNFRQKLVNIRTPNFTLIADDKYYTISNIYEYEVISRIEKVNKFELELSFRLGVINWGLKERMFAYLYYSKGVAPFSNTENYLQNIGLLIGFSF